MVENTIWEHDGDVFSKGVVNNEYTVYQLGWSQLTRETYLYGSQICFPEEDAVTFENKFMPPQQIVKSWVSLSDYKRSRLEPSLPLLEEEREYHVHSVVKSIPEGCAFVKVVFYDQKGSILSYKVIREEDEDFVYPKGAFSYEIQLVQGGAERIDFQCILLMEGKTNCFLDESIVYNPNPKSRKLNVIVPELGHRTNRIPQPDVLWNISNLCYASLKMLFPNESTEFLPKIAKQNWEEIRLISYGRQAETSALYWERTLENGNAVLVNNYAELSKLAFDE